MSVPTMAVYTSPPGPVYASSELETTSRGSAPCATAASPSPASSHRHAAVAGGLSCLFSSPTAASRASALDELSALWHDRSDDPAVAPRGGGGGYSCPQSSSPLKWRDHLHHSPVLLFHSPASSPASRSPSASWLAGRDRDRLFSSFVRNALGSCIDYAPVAAAPLPVDAAELAFDLDDSLAEEEPSSEPYARALLAGAQDRHRIFHDELVVKAFFEAEKAHRGQTRASGDPYLQHCVETAVLLAKIGANAAVVSAGLLHDTIDDSFMHGFKGAKASQGDGGAPQRLGAQGALQGDAFEAALLEAKHQLGRMSRGKAGKKKCITYTHQTPPRHQRRPDSCKASISRLGDALETPWAENKGDADALPSWNARTLKRRLGDA